MLLRRSTPSLLILAVLGLAGLVTACRSNTPLPDNFYAGKTENAVRTELGEPARESAGHYANPPLTFTKQFRGEVKTLVFKKRGGEIYVSFEKRLAGSIAICSSWLPKGAEF